jgi:hypothetical protein
MESRVTPTEEPDGGNLLVRIWRGAGTGNLPAYSTTRLFRAAAGSSAAAGAGGAAARAAGSSAARSGAEGDDKSPVKLADSLSTPVFVLQLPQLYRHAQGAFRGPISRRWSCSADDSLAPEAADTHGLPRRRSAPGCGP